MNRRAFLLSATAPVLLPACAPLVIAGAGAVVADAVVEENQGGDGLF